MEEIERTAAEWQHDALIDIEVEEGEPCFELSRNLLCDTSEYFKAALSGNRSEASDRCLRLPGTDTNTFKLSVFWPRRGTIPSFKAEINALPRSAHDQHGALLTDHIVLLAKLWILRGLILLPKLQNAAIEELLDLIGAKIVPFDATYQGFQVAPKGSKLSQVFIAEYGLIDQPSILADDFERLSSIPGCIVEIISDVHLTMETSDSFNFFDIFASSDSKSKEGGYLVM